MWPSSVHSPRARLPPPLSHASHPVSLRCLRVFGGPGDGDLASPLTLAEALRKYKAVTASLGQQLEAAHAETAAHVVRCKEVLAQHHAAWAVDREREAMRHAEEVARLRDLHARTLRHLELQAPAVYGRAAEEAEEAAIRAARQQHRF